ncbi:MAG TPA: hypothetical protein VK856_05665 [Anaerolineaceae bacterium]|nr:hypothetical protein [Anaerolineaceae bacterium]
MDENSVFSWLMASPIPTIRYKSLLDLKGLSADHPDCIAEYEAIQQSGVVPAILNQQVEPGHWKYPKHYYTPKYTSTHWSMMLLEELLCDPEETGFQTAIEFMLTSTQKDIVKYSQNQYIHWTCLWGNIIRYCVHGGKLADPRLQNLIDLTANSLLKEQCKCEWNWLFPCVWGAARSIWGLISIPNAVRSNLVEDAIDHGVEFVLENVNLIIKNEDLPVEKKTHPIWLKINFPLFYQSDVLFVLRLLHEMNALDHPLAENLLVWLKSKRKTNGRWQGSSPFRQRTYKEIGDKEDTSRWVTLQATSILKKAGLHA